MDGLTPRTVAEIVVRMVLTFGAVFTAIAYLTFMERKVSAWMQDRIGPNRVGPWGLLQPLADGLKHLMKEDVTPVGAQRAVFILAPIAALVPALVSFAVIPFGGSEINLRALGLPWDFTLAPYIADLGIGLLFVLGLASLEVYGVVLAGWSSGNHYSMLGGIRSSAQMVSYELAMGLAVVSVVMAEGSLRLQDIATQQAGVWLGVVPRWNLFLHPVAFIVLLVAVFAETRRAPFDLPEAEPELVGGYHTEYSSMKFLMFYMAEYAAMITNAGLVVTLFLGGWQVPWIVLPQPWMALAQVAAFAAKTAVLLFLFLWVRWTLPRFRYDQLMDLGWKRLFPVALANLLVVGALVAAGVF